MWLAKLFFVFAITLLAASYAVLQIPTALACSCARPPEPLSSLDSSKAVFAGQVTNIDLPISAGHIRLSDRVKVSFEVAQSWKGPLDRIITVSTASSGAMCGYGFKAGEEYLVYAGGDDNRLWVSLCSRTMLLATASDDLSALTEGKVPNTQPSGFSLVTLGIIGLALAVTIVSVGVLFKICFSRGKSP